MSEVTIQPAKPGDAPAVAAFCQPIYAAVYPNDQYGMKPEHFSAEVFQTPDTLAYIAKTMLNHDAQRAYIAGQAGAMTGTISIERFSDHYEIHAFYVALSLQGQGIGTRLLAKALEFSTQDLPIRVEVAETNSKSIALYQKWGFQLQPELGVLMRHWPEWPEGVENGYIFLQANKADLHV